MKWTLCSNEDLRDIWERFFHVYLDMLQTTCFAHASLVSKNVAGFNFIMRFHRRDEQLHAAIDNIEDMIRTRKRVIGKSNIFYRFQRRDERIGVKARTDRQKSGDDLKLFVGKVLPFLKPEMCAADDFTRLHKPLCIQAI